jgi:hypothetical protein
MTVSGGSVDPLEALIARVADPDLRAELEREAGLLNREWDPARFPTINVAVVCALVDAYRELLPVLETHLADNEGEVLSYLLLSDVVRWLVAHRESHPDLCRSVFSWLEDQYERGPDEVRNLIALGAVEMIPDPGEPGAELRDLLGPRLRAADPWL